MRKQARRAARRPLRWRRLRAVLAGGLVLGIGAAATLAAWNDSEHTSATITAGTFGIVGSSNGSTFTEHPAAGSAATLSFSPAATALTPGATTYALFAVRSTAASVAGSVALRADQTANAAGLATSLTYGVRTISSATCNQATYDASTTTIVPGGSALTTHGTQARPVSANAGSTVFYCFAITLAPNAGNGVQGTSTTPRWEFAATSS